MLDAGFALFGTAGFPNTTISGLCSKAGVTERHFYEEFASREALLRDVYEAVAARAFEEVFAATPRGAGGSPEDRIRKRTQAYFQYLTRDPRRARIYALEIMATGELQQHRRATRERFVSALARGIARMESRDDGVGIDARLVAAAIAGAAHELLVDWVLAADRPHVEEMADAIASLWIRALRLEDRRQTASS